MLCYEIGSLCQSSSNLVGRYSNLEIKTLVSETQQRRRCSGKKHAAVSTGLWVHTWTPLQGGLSHTFGLL